MFQQAFSNAGVTDIEVTADGSAVNFSSSADFDIGVATVTAATGTVSAADMGLDAALAAAPGSVTGSIEGIDISAASDTQVENNLKIVDQALLEMTTASTKLGALTSRINSQQSFVKALMDANTSAVGALVDANMEEESTKLKALQTQQQLAVQSLSIANASTQSILLLFRG